MPMLSEDELERFRTKFCTLTRTSGCEFGPERCNYSHNDYWPRRCPFYLKDRSALRYVPVCCPEVKLGSGDTVMESKCPRGGHCPFAHSAEEIWYHPLIYKVQVCEEYRRGECDRYYCPKVHGLAEQRCPKCYNLPYCRGVNIPHFPGVTIVDKLKSPSVRRGTSRAASHASYSTNLSAINSSSSCQYSEGTFASSRSNSSLKVHKGAENKCSTSRQLDGLHSIVETFQRSSSFREYNANGDCEELDKIGMVTKDWFAAYGCGDEDPRSMDVCQGDFVRVWVRNKTGWLYCQCIQGSNASAEGWIPASVVHELPQDYDGETQGKKWQNFTEATLSLQYQQSGNTGVKTDPSKAENRQNTPSPSGNNADVAAMFSLLTTNDSLFQVNGYPLLLTPLSPSIESEVNLHGTSNSVSCNAEAYPHSSSFAKHDGSETCDRSESQCTNIRVHADDIPVTGHQRVNVKAEKGIALQNENKNLCQLAQIEQMCEQLRALSASSNTPLEYWTKIVNSSFDLLGVALIGQRLLLANSKAAMNIQDSYSTFTALTIKSKAASEEIAALRSASVDEPKMPEGETVSSDPSIASEKIGGESPSKCGAICNAIRPNVSEQKKHFDEKTVSSLTTTGSSGEGWMDWKIVCPDLLSTLDGTNTEDVLSQMESSYQQQQFCDLPDQYSCHDLFTPLFSLNGSYQVTPKSKTDTAGSGNSDSTA